ncbi:MAG TPA: response regulator transcription factor [Roseiflexaceae bacterium]|nr:response regulator transcription factor [Roseiflexaceae bacterium]
MPIRVVLADDHPVVRAGIRKLLEHAPDITIIGEAHDGVQALHMADVYVPDVLLLDMELPVISGVQVARQLHTSGSPVRVLALSTYDDDQYIFGLLECGAAGYLTKEEAPETIVEAVRGVVRGEAGWLSRRVTARVVRRSHSGSAHSDEVASATLTEREGDVLRLIALDWENQRIAEKLKISERTVKFHISNIYQKLHVTSRTGAILYAIKRGWIDIAHCEPCTHGQDQPLP